MSIVVQAKQLCKVYGENTAVDHVNMTIQRGDIYGLIGENGAGKTTFMRMVCGLAEPNGGELTLFGSGDLEQQRRKMGCTIENAALYPAMTAQENMEVYRRLLKLENRRVIPDLLEFVGLHNLGNKKAKDFSLGMKQRLMIAIALMGEPELLILDEPMNGLDPMGIREVRSLLLKLNHEKNLTIVVSSHILDELSKIATRYGVIHKGKMVDEFSAQELGIRCRNNISITADNPQKAIGLLRDSFGISAIPKPDGKIVFYEQLDKTAEMNALLVKSGIQIKAIVPGEQDLEEYFMSLMGGKNA